MVLLLLLLLLLLLVLLVLVLVSVLVVPVRTMMARGRVGHPVSLLVWEGRGVCWC